VSKETHTFLKIEKDLLYFCDAKILHIFYSNQFSGKKIP
jgi:hypothetical protein